MLITMSIQCHIIMRYKYVYVMPYRHWLHRKHRNCLLCLVCSLTDITAHRQPVIIIQIYDTMPHYILFSTAACSAQLCGFIMLHGPLPCCAVRARAERERSFCCAVAGSAWSLALEVIYECRDFWSERLNWACIFSRAVLEKRDKVMSKKMTSQNRLGL